MNIAVIGSGLSSLGSILSLVENGITPTLIDAGNLVDDEIKHEFSKLNEIRPSEWMAEDRQKLISTLNATTRRLPKKLSFGSSRAYGHRDDLYEGFHIPPYSHYFGGFSQIWGASVLQTPKAELRKWPVDYEVLKVYFEKVVSVLPYAANSSSLDEHFGKPIENSGLSISQKDRKCLDQLNRRLSGNFYVGESRLLVHSSGVNGCQYCGHCMTGCVYKSIFSSSQVIKPLILEGKVNYIGGHTLNRIIEIDNQITLELENINQEKIVMKNYDKVYLGSGAVETTRIIMNSVEDLAESEISGRGSCVIPLLGFSSRKIEWPSTRTLPGIFIEKYSPRKNSWSHIQMSNQNELVYKAFGYLTSAKFGFFRKYILANLSTLMINDNYNYGVLYKLKRNELNEHKINVNFEKKGSKSIFLLNSFINAIRIGFALRSLPLLPFTKMNSQTYHLGGSFPMVAKVSELHQTDQLGRLRNFRNLHIIDSSTYPTLPSTTLGLLLTSNAWRITSESLDEKNTK